MLLHECDQEAQAELVLRGELKVLLLSYRLVGDDGAEIIADFLKHNDSVRKVFLTSCGLGVRGAKAIAEALKHNKTVWLLDLGGNQLGGADPFIDAFNYNVCLMSVHVVGRCPSLRALVTIDYLTTTRNGKLVPAAVRRASLCLISARCTIAGAGDFSVLPKEIVRMIAIEVWASRKDPRWLETLSESERKGRMGV